jgi:hypothetical protein
MNGQEFHLFDTTVGLLDPSEINSDSRNSEENPLFLRVILAARVYPEERAGGDTALRWPIGARRPLYQPHEEDAF